MSGGVTDKICKKRTEKCSLGLPGRMLADLSKISISELVGRETNYRIFQAIRRTLPPNLGGKWGCVS